MVKSANRVLDILELLSQSNGGLRLGEISEKLDLPASSAHGLIRTLTTRGYLRLNEPNKTYDLTFKVLEFGRRHLQKMDLTRVASPIMQRIRETRIDETINLAVLDGSDIVYVAKEESAKTLRLTAYVSIGMKLPAHATALGKVLLSGLDECQINALYRGKKLEALTARTITDLSKLKKELNRARINQYARDEEESTEGLCCFAAPILNHEDIIVAAISVSVPRLRLDQEYAKRIISALRHAAAEISQNLGATNFPGENRSRPRVNSIVQ